MRAEKESIAREIREKMDGAVFVILADYRGMTVSKTDDLRRRLGAQRARFQVVPNRMIRRVAPALEEGLTGPSAMVYGDGDVVQVAKILRDFMKEHELPVIKVGRLEGAILSGTDLQQLAGLPSRPELLGRLVGTIAAPLSRTVGVLSQKVASLLYVLKAIQNKKQAA